VTVEQLSKKTGQSQQMIRIYAKKINPYCFVRGELKRFSKREVSEILEILPKKTDGLSRSEVERENDITPYIGRIVAEELGILNKKGGKAMIPREIVPEFVRLAKQIKPRIKKRINIDDYYTEQYEELCKQGRMKLNDFLSRFSHNYTSVYDRLDKLNLLFYIDSDGKTKYIYPLRPAVERWKEENRHIIKNGCIGKVGLNI